MDNPPVTWIASTGGSVLKTFASAFERSPSALLQGVLRLLSIPDATLAPGRRPVSLHEAGDWVELTIPRLDLHEIIVFE
jgi:hypothetical protein